MPDLINVYRGTPGDLPADISAEIIEKVRGESAIMRLARQIALPGRGAVIPVITSDPTAAWVAETGSKPVSTPGLSQKLMQAYKLAVIVPFSDEFRRDRAALYRALVERLPGALGMKFDATVIGAADAPGENFDQLTTATAQSLVPTASPAHTTYQGFTAAYADVAAAGGSVNGFALSPAGMGLVLNATDTSGRPIFLSNATDGPAGRILGQTVYEARGLYKAGIASAGGTDPGTPAVVGVAGDWNKALWGTVEGVKIGISDQTTLLIGTELVPLWQHNMFAVKAEIEVGFRCDVNCFNRLLGAVPTT